MSLRGPDYELVGVSVVGDGPIRSIVHLPLNADVQALYGLNGAGKLRLLRLAASALTGVRLATAPGRTPPSG